MASCPFFDERAATFVALYGVHVLPSEQVLLQAGAEPPSESYGKQASLTTPVLATQAHALFKYPPLHPKLVLSHETKFYGDKTTFTFVELNVATHILSEKASVNPKAQHDPHWP